MYITTMNGDIQTWRPNIIFSNHQYNYTDSHSGCTHGVNSDNMLRLNDFKECLLRELDSTSACSDLKETSES